jgi:hypothetical protein
LSLLPDSLTYLHVEHCFGLISLPPLPRSLKVLYVRDCPGIKNLPPNKDSSGKDLLPGVLIHDNDKNSNSAPEQTWGLEDISPSGVVQGAIPDCNFESALASMANSEQGRQQIQKMIKINTNADSLYTVTFPGDKDNPVTVTQDDLDHKNGDSVSDKELLWARIITTAFLKHDQMGTYASSEVLKPDDGNSSDGDEIRLIGNDLPFKTLYLLTGKNVAMDQLSPWLLAPDDYQYHRYYRSGRSGKGQV